MTVLDIYIIYVCVCVYIYIYIYIFRQRMKLIITFVHYLKYTGTLKCFNSNYNSPNKLKSTFG